MRAAIRSVLTVDERIKSLPEPTVGVREAKLKHLLRVMQRRINRLAVVRLQILHHQVEQTVLGLKRLAVVDQLQPAVEITVMPQPPLDVFGLELDLLKNRRVRLEPDQC